MTMFLFHPIKKVVVEVTDHDLHVGDKVEKIKGYKFRGTIIGMGMKLDEKLLAFVEIEAGENVEGLVYIHPIESLKKIA